MEPGDRLTLTVERPAAGGRMIARHDGAVVLVSGTIPGETVEAAVEKVQRGTVWAKTTRVVDPSVDRLHAASDLLCGGSVFAHIQYERQLALKRDIIRDAFARIGKMAVADDLPVARSPVDGYRMRARLHIDGPRIGLFREGTHELCDPAPTRQLLPDTLDALERLAERLGTLPPAAVIAVDVSENCPATERAFHLELPPTSDRSRLGSLPAIDGVTGVSCGGGESSRALVLWGSPVVTDALAVATEAGPLTVSLARHARSFFQGNRFLLPHLVATVVDAVPAGNALDLYAGVGLFAVALANRGGGDVTAIEGDRQSADDLKKNAATANGAIAARHQSVETFLAIERPSRITTVIVDPPRTGMSKAALTGAIGLRASCIVYISCDVATLARDARTLVGAGYRLDSVRAFDLFPNTAHVESVAVFQR